MRAGPVIAGSILLIVGLAAAVAGGMMKSAGDLCVEARCDSEEAYVFLFVGNGVFIGGALAGLAGIGLLVAGIMTDAKPRHVPVEGAQTTRPCPSCNAPVGHDARYCPSCGTAIAPVLKSRM